jgi:hypothetical protein
MSGKGKKGKDGVVMEFHGLIVTTFSAGVLSFNCNPSALGAAGLSRLLTEADAWAHFRWKQFRFRLRVTPSGATNAQACGFVGGVQDTPPASFSTIMELIPSCFMDVDQTVPTEWVSVSRSEMAGPLPWYKSIVGAADNTEEVPGALVLASTGSAEAVSIELRGVIEFKTSVAAANTPLVVQARLLARLERQNAQKEREGRAIRQVLAPASPLPAALIISAQSK